MEGKKKSLASRSPKIALECTASENAIVRSHGSGLSPSDALTAGSDLNRLTDSGAPFSGAPEAAEALCVWEGLTESSTRCSVKKLENGYSQNAFTGFWTACPVVCGREEDAEGMLKQRGECLLLLHHFWCSLSWFP